jgi:putative addiction module killer protein
MLIVQQTTVFSDWLGGLKDRRAAARIVERLNRVEGGLLGDVKPVGEGVSEMRITMGRGIGSTSCSAAR